MKTTYFHRSCYTRWSSLSDRLLHGRIAFIIDESDKVPAGACLVEVDCWGCFRSGVVQVGIVRLS